MQEWVTQTEEAQSTGGSKKAWQKNQGKNQKGEKYSGCEVGQSWG